ncbi:SIMPL domain-containing protein [Thalassobacillus hwangdonensis]|uniref:SIMPL domain-containing protein n=1 Tax=Thalassobacillus hwangdonensis TaxID=546108 RepID=A0ABW3L0H8_9BACI
MMYMHPYYRNTEPTTSWTMKVSGRGIVKGEPDQATVTLGFQNKDMSLKQAQEKNNQVIQAIIDALTRLGVAPEQIQTSEYRIFPDYDYKEGEQVFTGYQVNNILTLTLDDLSMIGAVIDTATSNGANLVRDVTFSIQDIDAYYNAALQQALQQAVSKAQTIAQSLQVNLNAVPIRIIESTAAEQPIPFAKSSMVLAAESSPTPIEKGQLTIEANIVATYQYFN